MLLQLLIALLIVKDKRSNLYWFIGLRAMSPLNQLIIGEKVTRVTRDPQAEPQLLFFSF